MHHTVEAEVRPMQQTFRCPECGAEFPTQQSLQDHVSREHMGTSTEGRTPQEKCPREVWSSRALRACRNMRRHILRARAVSDIAELVDAGVLSGSGDVPAVLGTAEVDALDVAIGDGTGLREAGGRGDDGENAAAVGEHSSVIGERACLRGRRGRRARPNQGRRSVSRSRSRRDSRRRR